MAVLVEAISVIIRADRLSEEFPGGWERFRGESFNQTLCADGELVRVGFMNPQDVKRFTEDLAAHGLMYLSDGSAQDVVVADQQRGLAAPCSWAEFGHIDWEGDSSKRVAACRLVGSSISQLIHPERLDLRRFAYLPLYFRRDRLGARVHGLLATRERFGCVS